MSMKKLFIIILVLVTVLVGGCSKRDELDEYEHYDLKDKDTSAYYSYIDEENNQIYEYIVADISIENAVTDMIHGLFFEVGRDDYILLDKIEVCNGDRESYKYQSYTRFYDNKLYINRCSGAVALEYTLDGRKITKVDMASKLEKPLLLSSIKEIDENYIFYSAKKHYTSEYQTLRCSREDYKCEIIDD